MKKKVNKVEQAKNLLDSEQEFPLNDGLNNINLNFFDPTEPALLAKGGMEKFNTLCSIAEPKLLKNLQYRLLLEAFCRVTLIDIPFTLVYWVQEPAAVLYKFWEKNPGFPIKVEGVVDTIVTYYTLPTDTISDNLDRAILKPISENHLKYRLKIWIIQLFGGLAIPKFVSSSTVSGLLAYIITPQEEKAVASTSSIVEVHFKNVSVVVYESLGLLVEKESKQDVVLRFFPNSLPYSAYVSQTTLLSHGFYEVMTKNVHKTLIDQTLGNFSNSFLSNEKVTTFLTVLSEGSPIKLMVLRCFLRRCITAHIDGKSTQTGLWLFGAQGTLKSTLATLSRKVSGEKYCDITAKVNQFSYQTLFRSNVALFSDIDTLSASHRKMLRQGIGRDIVSCDIKFKNKTIAQSVFAQFLITSNKHPNQFGALWQLPEMRERIIPLFLENSIPPEYMVGNIENYLDELLPFILAWALYTPTEWLNQQVRSSLIVNLLRDQRLLPPDLNRIDSIHDFIEQNLVFVDQAYLDQIESMSMGPEKINALDSVSLLSEDFQVIYEKWTQQKFSKKLVLSRETFLYVLHTDYNATHIKLRRLGPRTANRPERFWGIVHSECLEKNSSLYKPCEMILSSIRKEDMFSFGNIEQDQLDQIVYGSMAPVEFLSLSDSSNFHEKQKNIVADRGQVPFSPIKKTKKVNV